MLFFKPKKTLPIPYSHLLLGAFSTLIVLSYFFCDLRISEWMHSIPHSMFLIAQGINQLFEPEIGILVLPLLFFVFRAFTKKETLANLFLFMAITVNATHILIVPIKMLLGRFRPEMWISQHLYGLGFFTHNDAEMSFPSGHVGVLASILFSLACIYPKKFPEILFLTFVLSFCRVIVNDHYMSDILASMLLALFVSQWIYVSLKRAKVSF